VERPRHHSRYQDSFVDDADLDDLTNRVRHIDGLTAQVAEYRCAFEKLFPGSSLEDLRQMPRAELLDLIQREPIYATTATGLCLFFYCFAHIVSPSPSAAKWNYGDLAE
jgi:hypothetical protein